MSGTEVDLDRLADYVGGALDGTPDADDVRHLVATDTGWSDAYTALLTAVPLVQRDLAALGDDPPVMPADVVARLDAALGTGVARGGLSAVGGASAVPRKSARRRRWVTALTAAAAILVCGFVGVGVVSQLDRAVESVTSAPDSGSDTEGGAPAPAAGPPGFSGPQIESGRDYQRGEDQSLRSSADSPRGAIEASQSSQSSTADDELAPLKSPARLDACLRAITGEYGGVVALVDFARFEGRPALVVLIDGARAAGGRRWMVVVGPGCGTANAITDERYHGVV